VGRDFSLYEQRFYRWTDAPEPNKYNLDKSNKLKSTLARLVMFKKIHDHPVMETIKLPPKCQVGNM